LRQLTRLEPNSTSTTWEWGNGVNGAYNQGKLKSVTSIENGDTYQEVYAYDNRTRLIQKSISLPITGVGMTSFTYDYGYEPHKGWLDTLTYPLSTSGYRLALKYGYQNGLLNSVADANAPSTVFWTAMSTDAFGHTTEETLGNGIVTTRAFDPVTGWLSRIESGPSGNATAVQNLAYGYDLVGNVTQRQNNKLGLTENFYYAENGDDLYRLGHSTLSDGSTTTTNLALSYDPSGSIQTKDEPLQPPLAAQTIVWTPYNYPSQITVGTQTASFSYGPDRQRWKMELNDGTHPLETVYTIGGLLEVVKIGSTTTYRHTIVGGGGPVAIMGKSTAGEVLHYVLTDHQGSTESFVENGSGTVTNASFTAFGLRRDADTWSGEPDGIERTALDQITRQGYTYQTVLASMGLNHMNGRVQDAVTGRFLSADPYITEPDYTQNFNRYSYVYNNPLSLGDPSGFGSEDDSDDDDDDDTCRGGGSACADAAAAAAAAAFQNALETVVVTGHTCNAECMQIVRQLAAQWKEVDPDF
jgi:RHS repeat-associated protein